MTFRHGIATVGAMLVLGLLAAHDAAAQTIRIEGRGDVFVDDRIERVLRSGRYVAITRDTTLTPADTIGTTVLVLDARLQLEGTILGDLIGVDAELFLRPGSHVSGGVWNAGGGLYASDLATTGRLGRDLPNWQYAVRREGETWVIVGEYPHRWFEPDGFKGAHVPRYNRVDGLALDVGATLQAPPVLAGFAPGVHAQVGYRTERQAWAGGGSAFVERQGLTLEGGWLRQTASNDRWIRGDLRNSVDFIFDGDDMRNYHETDVAFGEVRYQFLPGRAQATPRQLRRPERYLTIGARYQDEQARSLEAGDPWTLFGDDSVRVNPDVDPGHIRSVIAFAQAEWLTSRTAVDGLLSIEHGMKDLEFDPLVDCGPDGCPPVDGSFTRLRWDSEFGMQALANHTLEIELQFMMPLAGDEPLPRQRWGMLGGSGTIRTVEDGEFHGDHLAYSETEYIIPFRRLRIIRWVPQLELLHMAGLAWTGERADDEDFVQNVGARLRIFALFARYLIDPASGRDELTVGVTWPFDDREYPWQ